MCTSLQASIKERLKWGGEGRSSICSNQREEGGLRHAAPHGNTSPPPRAACAHVLAPLLCSRPRQLLRARRRCRAWAGRIRGIMADAWKWSRQAVCKCQASCHLPGCGLASIHLDVSTRGARRVLRAPRRRRASHFFLSRLFANIAADSARCCVPQAIRAPTAAPEPCRGANRHPAAAAGHRQNAPSPPLRAGSGAPGCLQRLTRGQCAHENALRHCWRRRRCRRSAQPQPSLPPALRRRHAALPWCLCTMRPKTLQCRGWPRQRTPASSCA